MLRVLLVEDNMRFRRTVGAVLMTYFPSMEILEASRGEEAMAIIERYHPDVAFVDIRLPGENGIKLTRKIKASHPEISVILLTTYDFPEYREAANQAGANYFMTKGGSTGEEIATLLNAIASNRPLTADGSAN